MLHGTKPDLSHLRIFGARAYAHIPTALRSKLDAVSEPGRFIGYPTNTKGHKILLDNGSIVISHDVTFNETNSNMPKPNLPKPNLPKPNLPETISLIDTDDTGDTESVGATAEPEARRQRQRGALQGPPRFFLVFFWGWGGVGWGPGGGSYT
jgi:hypothetical protein